MRKQANVLLTAAVVAILSAGGSAQTFIGQNFPASHFDPAIPRVADTNGAVGGDYFVELINPSYKVYRKSDGALVQSSTHNAFWAAAGAPHSGDRAFDPRVLYDPYARRWYALAVDNLNPQTGTAPPNNFLLAVSNSSDPTAGWTGFKIDSDSNDTHWADFCMLGFNREVVTLSANMFMLNSAVQPSLNTFVVIPRNDLLAPSPTIANARKFEEFPNSATGFAVQPAVDLDDGSLPLPLLSHRLDGVGLKRNGVVGSPTLSISTTGGFIPFASPNSPPPTADQPGPKANIWTFDHRFTSSVVKNNGELWAVNCVNQGGRAALRWYRINASTNTLIETGYISDPSMAYFFPSIAVNDLGDVVIGMSGTDPNTFVSAFAVHGKTIGGVTTFGTPFIMKAGVSDYERLDGIGRNRWGDYSATTNDPADPSIFWTIQEYVHATDVWGTQVTEIIVPQPGEVRWKDPANGGFEANGNWIGGATPTSTSHVIFSRATTPGGAGYSVNFGTDQTVDRLSVRQGIVTLDLLGTTVNATNASAATPSVAVGEFGGTPTLNVVGGTIIADYASLAASPTASATVNLSGGAKFQILCNLYAGGTEASAGGDVILNIDSGSTLQVAETLRVWDRGVVNFNSGLMSTGPLIVSGGGRVNVAPTGGTKVLRTSDVQTDSGGRIDLTSNAMTVDYAPAADGGSPLLNIKDQIASAHAGGSWTGPGIATSSGNGNQFGLGYGEAGAISTIPPIFGSVDGTTVLVRFTRYGDANLDAVVNLDDFNRLAGNFGQSDRFWTSGDFNYDMLVNLTDFNLLAGNFGLRAGPEGPTPEDWATLAAVVPEPMSTYGAVIATFFASMRRRSR